MNSVNENYFNFLPYPWSFISQYTLELKRKNKQTNKILLREKLCNSRNYMLL